MEMMPSKDFFTTMASLPCEEEWTALQPPVSRAAHPQYTSLTSMMPYYAEQYPPSLSSQSASYHEAHQFVRHNNSTYYATQMNCNNNNFN
jgi:hypothetical protein